MARKAAEAPGAVRWPIGRAPRESPKATGPATQGVRGLPLSGDIASQPPLQDQSGDVSNRSRGMGRWAFVNMCNYVSFTQAAALANDGRLLAEPRGLVDTSGAHPWLVSRIAPPRPDAYGVPGPSVASHWVSDNGAGEGEASVGRSDCQGSALGCLERSPVMGARARAEVLT
eukprot:3374164-Alexandrium_andersonii.AAC.1